MIKLYVNKRENSQRIQLNMRVECPKCLEKAVIAKRNKISDEVSDLYCSCSDPECGHSFVSTLSFKHTLSPSRSDSKSLALSILKDLPESERKLLLSQISTP